MELVIIALTAGFASLLTFFSGFGLGTILSPVMMIFFPPELAIALTGVVHFLNNLFKIGLVWKQIDWKTGIPFALAAFIGSFLGAHVLIKMAGDSTLLYAYTWMGREAEITTIKLMISLLILIFVLLEFLPRFQSVRFGKGSLIPGGFISGFFGGLSGNQGALRSMFLLKSGLGKEAYVATGIMIAMWVDISRLGLYATRFRHQFTGAHAVLLSVAVLSAFAGAYAGNRLLKKFTLRFVQLTVCVLLLLLALALGSGLL